MCESVGKADLLSDDFDSMQSRESVDLPLTRYTSHSLTTFGFRSSEVRRLLLDLDPCGGTDLLGMFPLFLKRTADVMDQPLVKKCKVFYGQKPPSGESTTTECVFNYQLLAVIY